MTVKNYNLDFKLDTPYLISENLFGSNINNSDIIALNLNNVSIKFHENNIMLILQKSDVNNDIISKLNNIKSQFVNEINNNMSVWFSSNNYDIDTINQNFDSFYTEDDDNYYVFISDFQNILNNTTVDDINCEIKLNGIKFTPKRFYFNLNIEKFSRNLNLNLNNLIISNNSNTPKEDENSNLEKNIDLNQSAEVDTEPVSVNIINSENLDNESTNEIKVSEEEQAQEEAKEQTLEEAKEQTLEEVQEQPQEQEQSSEEKQEQLQDEIEESTEQLELNVNETPIQEENVENNESSELVASENIELLDEQKNDEIIEQSLPEKNEVVEEDNNENLENIDLNNNGNLEENTESLETEQIMNDKNVINEEDNVLKLNENTKLFYKIYMLIYEKIKHQMTESICEAIENEIVDFDNLIEHLDNEDDEFLDEDKFDLNI